MTGTPPSYDPDRWPMTTPEEIDAYTASRDGGIDQAGKDASEVSAEPHMITAATLKHLAGGSNQPVASETDGWEVRKGDLTLIRNVPWLWKLYIQRGALNSITGGGGAGKTTLVCYMAARLSTGTLPGELFGTPTNTLILANEDDPETKWDPIVAANGGDVSRVLTFRHTTGQQLNTLNPKHMDALAAHIRRNDVSFVVIDAVLDVFDQSSNSHNQKDVRLALAPFRGLCKTTGVTCVYMLHPNKASGQNMSLRDRAGGSGQFTDVGRSNLFVGYHREKEGYRAVTRGKANNGADPGALVFALEPVLITNPETQERVEAIRLADVTVDPFLTSEDLSTGPVRQQDPGLTVEEKIVAVAMQVGADGEFKQRGTLAAAVMDQHKISERSFERGWTTVKDQFETDKEGRNTLWRLKKNR